MSREDDVRKIVTGGRSRGLSDDQIRALVKRYDERSGSAPPTMPSAATAGMLAPSSLENRAPMSTRERVDAGLRQYEADTMADPAKRFGIGMEKGFENTILGAAELASRAGIGDRDAITRARAGNQPQGTAERLGYAAEQVGEFVALPVAKGSLVRRVAQEAGETGALSAAQGGDPVVGAVAGAAGPLISAWAQTVRQTPIAQRAAGALRESAEKRVAQALGATKERFKAMAEKLAPDMLDRGVPGRAGASRATLLKQATEQASVYGRAIDDAIEGAKDEVISTRLIIDALEEAKAGFQVPRRMSVAEAAKQGLVKQAKPAGDGLVDVIVTLDSRPIRQLEKLQHTLAQLGDNATVEHIVAARRVWDDVVSRAGGFQHRKSSAFGVPLSEQTEAWAKREATTAIRKALAESQPDLAAVNKEYAFWANLRDVLRATEKRTQAQSSGLAQTIAGGAGATAGALTGNNTEDRIQNLLIGGAAGGALGRQLVRTVTSPRWRLVSADVRNRLAEALVDGHHGRLISALSRATAAVQGGGALQPAPAR